MDEAVIDASEAVLERLETDDDVAYAAVGGVDRRVADAVVADGRVRSANDLRETGVWWRLFADGAADYRYVTTLDDDHVEEVIARSLRSARMLDQSTPASYDWGTVHRATHPGWGESNGRGTTDGGDTDDREAVDDGRAVGDGEAADDGEGRAVPADARAERVRTALADAFDGVDVDLDRSRATLRDERVETLVSTTTGSAVRTTLDRASVETTVVPAGGPTLHRHDGATTGERFLDSLADRFADLASRTREAAAADEVALDASPLAGGGRADVVLGPLAAGELLHHLSHYFETDLAYFGSSPVDVGDRLGPESLSVADAVPPGSWAARAYDAEPRPTQPVSLVDDGVVRSRLHDVSTAIEEETHPAGHLLPALGFDGPPRIHARHLDVAAGGASETALRADADLYVERLGTPRFGNEATRTKRASTMPPSPLYAKDIAESTPAEFADEADDQSLHLPVDEGYLLDGGDRAARVTGVDLTFAPADLRAATLGGTRRTLTGTCEKHKTRLPFAVTAPAVRLPLVVRG
ncbi:metallopeptidase TldD-related protein [Candidatus Halobonum tyrrellensis]|uniref:Peptidase U62 modulator of DNA gyrase n=1 Tax=Candidatus Halobonum tyrrellensis G22 TaxID=1324957 RepID=V4IZB5_9EURY|nr:metallopeptidase TldD-related protein [Candidatus Halobonum tyrrellensis]ESP88462.1 peptidase U62 modulator of DNA gyrase [Candidatus Halobonum tyrrellensis G22]